MMERKERASIKQNANIDQKASRQQVASHKVKRSKRGKGSSAAPKKRRPKSYATSYVRPPAVEPSSQDVLCGRGRTNFHHRGNERFRRIVGENLEKYISTQGKTPKTRVIQCISAIILEGGTRFLKADDLTGAWHEAAPNTAREKIGHALRDAMGNKCRAIKDIHLQSVEVAEHEASETKKRTEGKERAHEEAKKLGIDTGPFKKLVPAIEPQSVTESLFPPPILIGSHNHPPVRFDHPAMSPTNEDSSPDTNGPIGPALATVVEDMDIEAELNFVLSSEVYDDLTLLGRSDSGSFSDSMGECLDFLDSISLGDFDDLLTCAVSEEV